MEKRAKEKEGREKIEDDENGFSPSSDHIQDKDPLYEEFLQGDANRRLFPRAKLEEAFQAWQSERGGNS